MAYKFQRGSFRASGSTVVEEGVTVDTGGLTVSAGNIIAAASQLTASALSSSTAQFGTLSVASFSPSTVSTTTLTVTGVTTLSGNVFLGDAPADIITVNGQITGSLFDINGGTIDGVTIATSDITVGSGKTLNVSAGTLTLAAGQVGADKVGAGTFNAGTFSFNGSTISDLGSVTTADINGGTIDATSIGATTPSSVRATTLSASSNLQVGTSITASSGVLVNAGGLTVSAGDSSVQKLTVNGDLVVLGNTFSASVGTLLIEDAAIVIGDGSTAFGSNYGLLFGSGSNQWASLQTAVALAGTENVLSSSLTLKTNSTITNVANPVFSRGDADVTLSVGVNYGSATVTLPRTWTLPSTGILVGQSVKVKAADGVSSTNTITIQRAGSQTIDGENFITLESPYAAVELVYVATDTWRVF